MTYLSDLIEVRHRNVRSVNVERELDSSSPLAGFVATEQVLDVVRRIVHGTEPGARTRAWSITGPYGAGKSSLAHFVCALYGRGEDATTAEAHAILEAAEPALAERVRASAQVTGRRGLIRAAATAEREPITSTVTRALARGAESYWARRGRKKEICHELHAAAARVAHGEHPDPQFVLQKLDELVCVAPVLLVLDELGKALEFAADRSRESDLYLLQQIAERLSGDERFRGEVLALQHLAFEDYATSLSAARRLEWRKIQGRFEDVPFAGSAGHAAALIGESLRQRRKIRAVSDGVKHAQAMLVEAVPEARPILAALGAAPAGYPIHPSAVPALIELSGRYGQHDRSLMAFLTSDAPEAVPAFLGAHAMRDGEPPFVRLPEVYDYFVEGAAALDFAGEDGAKLREIRSRVTEAHGLPPLPLRTLKAIGVLNLVGRGNYRATRELVLGAVLPHEATTEDRAAVVHALEELQDSGVIVYRDFVDEFRVWQGSDFDVAGAIADRREALAQDAILNGAPLERIAEVHPARNLVARRHSQEHDVLRYFEARYASRINERALDLRRDADGLLLYVLAPEGLEEPPPAFTADGRPVVTVVSRHVRDLTEAIVDAAATKEVLDATKDLQDVVARRELRHRAALAQAALSERVAATFDVSRRGVECHARGAQTEIRADRGFSALLSDLCDETYTETPIIANEMLNRRELTSQGAKTRRLLIEAMFTRAAEPQLGIEGFGPDRAMYEAVLASTGFHAERDGVLSFGPPAPDSGVTPAWNAINRFFDEAVEATRGVDELYAMLMRPPLGMKEGPIPVLLAAALLARSDDIFVFEDGTFLPRLGPEHLERLVKTPGRFAVKRAALLGVRGEVFRELESLVGTTDPLPAQVRNATTLGVVRPLIMLLQNLPEFARQTGRVSPRAQEIRSVLATTREPDELIFHALPAACGHEAFAADGKGGSATAFVQDLAAALDELTTAYSDLLSHVADTLRETFDTRGPSTVRALREDLRARSRHLIEHVIDRRLRAFLLVADNEDFGDEEWLEAVATVLAQKPPSGWIDTDVPVFHSATLEVSRAFRRLELLHHQMAGREAGTFAARRITVTHADGREDSDLVWLDSQMTDALESAVEDALEVARRANRGRQGEQALLAMIAERVLTERSDTTEESLFEKADRRVS